MITIYHLNMSRSERIIWLMEELGLEYKLEKFSASPAWRPPSHCGRSIRWARRR